MESLRILMVSPSVMIPEDLAQSIHQWEFARWLSRMGHEVHMLCRRRPEAGAVDRDTDEDGVYYHKVMSADFPLKRIFFTRDTHKKAREILDSQKWGAFDIVHDRGYLFGGAGIKAAKAKGLPVVMQIDDDWITSEAHVSKVARTSAYQKKSREWCKWALDHADRSFTVSKKLRDIAVDEWGGQRSKVSLVPNGVEVDDFRPDLKPMGLGRNYGREHKGGHIVMFIGALGPWHGVENLIEAAPLIVKENPKTRFFVIGGAKEYASEELQARASDRGLDGRMFFTGRIPKEKVPRALAEADVAVAPYPDTDFGFSPFKLFEYMASGRAIVASDLEAIREILDHGKTGILTQCWEPAKLAEAVNSLLADDKRRKRLGEEARRIAVSKYTWEASTKKLVDVYRKVL